MSECPFKIGDFVIGKENMRRYHVTCANSVWKVTNVVHKKSDDYFITLSRISSRDGKGTFDDLEIKYFELAPYQLNDFIQIRNKPGKFKIVGAGTYKYEAEAARFQVNSTYKAVNMTTGENVEINIADIAPWAGPALNPELILDQDERDLL